MKIYPMIFRFVNISAFNNEFHVDTSSDSRDLRTLNYPTTRIIQSLNRNLYPLICNVSICWYHCLRNYRTNETCNSVIKYKLTKFVKHRSLHKRSKKLKIIAIVMRDSCGTWLAWIKPCALYLLLKWHQSTIDHVHRTEASILSFTRNV